MAFCRKCGAYIGDDAFCRYCGTYASNNPSDDISNDEYLPKPYVGMPNDSSISGGKGSRKKAFALILIAFVVFLVLIGSIIPDSEDYVYHVELSVEDLVIHSDLGTLYNVQQNGYYYDPDTEDFTSLYPSTKGKICIQYNASYDDNWYYGDMFDVLFSGNETNPLNVTLLSLDLPSYTSNLTIFLITDGNTEIDLISGDDAHAGIMYAMTSETNVINGTTSPCATGKIIWTVNKVYK